jgi:hypothetical protein
MTRARTGKVRQVMGLVLSYRPTKRLTLWVTFIYAFIYLWAVGDLGFHAWRPDFSVIWTHEPIEMLFKQRNLFYFEGIAIVNLPIATYLFSPVNLVLGLLLGLLVGLNSAFTYLSIKDSEAFKSRGTLNLLVSIPALLAGTTCSAPLVLVALGVQASAAVLAFFSFLVPVALVLLLCALVFNFSRTEKEKLLQFVTEDSQPDCSHKAR